MLPLVGFKRIMFSDYFSEGLATKQAPLGVRVEAA